MAKLFWGAAGYCLSPFLLTFPRVMIEKPKYNNLCVCGSQMMQGQTIVSPLCDISSIP